MTSTPSWRRRFSLAIASAGALILTPFAPIAAADDAPDLSDAQVSYYSFDDDAVTDSWGDRSGELTGEVPIVEGNVGNAASIVDGNSVTFPTPDLEADWTVGFWVKAPTASDKSNILESADGERAISQRINAARGDKMGMYVHSETGGFLTYEHTLPNDEWTHITWTQSSTVGLSLYMNGELRENKSWAIQNPVAFPADILGGENFTGLVDELKVYNRALTAEEVPTTIENLEVDEPGPLPEPPAVFSVLNPKPEGLAFELGDTIRFNLQVTNDTGVTRSFESVDSNLDNWTSCKWSALAAGDTQPCSVATHTVTEEDLEVGSFTPSMTFQIYGTTGYSGPAVELKPFVGDPVLVAPRLVTIDSFEFTGGIGNESYSAGDELTAALTITNVFEEQVSVSLNDDALTCAGDIAPGESGGFNWLSQHLDEKGVSRWLPRTGVRRPVTCPQRCVGSGVRIGPCGHRCAPLGARHPRGRCSVSSGR